MSEHRPDTALRAEVSKALIGIERASDLPDELRIAICETLAWVCELDVALAAEGRSMASVQEEIPPATPRAELPPGGRH